MPSGRISKSSVDALQPRDKDHYLWDSELSGFAVKTTPAGRKVFLVQYRLGGRKGRTRRVTIGSYGKITPDQARSQAKRLLGEVSMGRDPAEDRDARRAEQSIGVLLKLFLSEHADTKLKASSATEYRRIAHLYVDQAFKHRMVGDVTRSDVSRLHHSMSSKPYQANRTLAILSKFFNWCEQCGYRPDNTNPCRHVEKFKEKKRERFLSEDELVRLGNALRDAERAETATTWMIAAIRLLALTGARRNEVLTLRWEDVNFERGCLSLPDSKTGQKTIYLNLPALQALKEIPKLEGNPFVICGGRVGAHLANLQKPWQEIRRAAGLEDVRIHDLRHSYASVAAASGLSLPVIGALLGHSQPATTQRYAHFYDDPLRAASDEVGHKIQTALSGTSQDGTNVEKLEDHGRS